MVGVKGIINTFQCIQSIRKAWGTTQPPVTSHSSATLGDSRPASANMVSELLRVSSGPQRGRQECLYRKTRQNHGQTKHELSLRTLLNSRAACEEVTVCTPGPSAPSNHSGGQSRPDTEAEGCARRHSPQWVPFSLEAHAGVERGGQDIPSPPHKEGKGTDSLENERPAEE